MRWRNNCWLSLQGKYCVAENNNEVAGCMMITNEWSYGNVLWIQSVYFKPSNRGQGVFKKRYEHMQCLVTPESGYRGIRLYVDKTKAAAQKNKKRWG